MTDWTPQPGDAVVALTELRNTGGTRRPISCRLTTPGSHEHGRTTCVRPARPPCSQPTFRRTPSRENAERLATAARDYAVAAGG